MSPEDQQQEIKNLKASLRKILAERKNALAERNSAIEERNIAISELERIPPTQVPVALRFLEILAPTYTPVLSHEDNGNLADLKITHRELSQSESVCRDKSCEIVRNYLHTFYAETGNMPRVITEKDFSSQSETD